MNEFPAGGAALTHRLSWHWGLLTEGFGCHCCWLPPVRLRWARATILRQGLVMESVRDNEATKSWGQKTHRACWLHWKGEDTGVPGTG